MQSSISHPATHNHHVRSLILSSARRHFLFPSMKEIWSRAPAWLPSAQDPSPEAGWTHPARERGAPPGAAADCRPRRPRPPGARRPTGRRARARPAPPAPPPPPAGGSCGRAPRLGLAARRRPRAPPPSRPRCPRALGSRPPPGPPRPRAPHSLNIPGGSGSPRRRRPRDRVASASVVSAAGSRSDGRLSQAPAPRALPPRPRLWAAAP